MTKQIKENLLFRETGRTEGLQVSFRKRTEEYNFEVAANHERGFCIRVHTGKLAKFRYVLHQTESKLCEIVYGWLVINS